MYFPTKNISPTTLIKVFIIIIIIAVVIFVVVMVVVVVVFKLKTVSTHSTPGTCQHYDSLFQLYRVITDVIFCPCWTKT
jgi:flagellar basal body-associated protein FliL